MVFYKCFFPIIHCATYILSSGETRQTQTAIFFNTKTKDREEGNRRISSKRKRNELTSTLVGEEDSETTHCSQQLRSTDKNRTNCAKTKSN